MSVRSNGHLSFDLDLSPPINGKTEEQATRARCAKLNGKTEEQATRARCAKLNGKTEEQATRLRCATLNGKTAKQGDWIDSIRLKLRL